MQIIRAKDKGAILKAPFNFIYATKINCINNMSLTKQGRLK